MEEIDCPWASFKVLHTQWGKLRFEGCSFLKEKTKCLLKPWEKGDLFHSWSDKSVRIQILNGKAKCCRITAFIQRLHGCLLDRSLRRSIIPENEHILKFLHDRFCRTNNPEYFADLLMACEYSYTDFLYRIGMFLAIKCREEPSCPYKPLLPENL